MEKYLERFFGSIDLRKHWNFYDKRWEKLVKYAVDRSLGGLVEFSIQNYYGQYNLLNYVGYHAKSLRCLRLVGSCMFLNELIDVVREVLFLEELDLSYFSFAIPGISELLLQLTKNEGEEVAFAIAENMPELRRLHLAGTQFTNEGLRAIVDGCPYMEYLDLRCAFGFGGLQTKCLARIKEVRLPEDSFDDYEYEDVRRSRQHPFLFQKFVRSRQYLDRYYYPDEISEDVEDDDDHDTLIVLPPKDGPCYL